MLLGSHVDLMCPNIFLLDLSFGGVLWHARVVGLVSSFLAGSFCLCTTPVNRGVGVRASHLLGVFSSWLVPLLLWLILLLPFAVGFLFSVGHFNLLPFIDFLPLEGLCMAFWPPCSLARCHFEGSLERITEVFEPL